MFYYFNVGCEIGARQRGANQRQRNGKSRGGKSGHWRQDRHLDQRAPLLALRTQSSSLLVAPPAWRNGQPQHLDPPPGQRGGQLDSSKRLLARKAPATSLEFWRTNDAWTQVSFKNATSCTTWSAPAALPRQPQTSFTILTQADWCAVRTVARCEAGFLPVAGTVEAGARLIW